jgi:Zn-dependent protease
MSATRRRQERERERERERSELGGGFRLGRIFGVDIHVDWSLLIIFALITVNLGAGLFPSWHPEWGLALHWTVALGAAILFFASVLAHELSHAVVGRAQGIPVRRITLFLFGGMAHMEAEPKSPKAEFLMAVVGPVVSILIGIVATVAGAALGGASPEELAESPEAALASVGPVASLLLWLGPINILLGVFNLVPGFPLDGGRVARSILWWATGDLMKATRWAAGAGRVFAWLLMGWGVVNLFGGAFVGGIWLLLIGWFLNNAARMSYEQLLVRHALEDVPVSRLMFRQPRTVEPGVTLDAFVRDHLMAGDQAAYPVVSGGTLEGLVTIHDLRRVPQQDWPHVIVAEIMTSAGDLVTLPPDADAEQALQELGKHDFGQLPVVEDNRVLGLVRRRDLVKWVALQRSEPGLAEGWPG